MPDQRELPLAFPEVAPEAPLIPVRMVNEYVYCPRLAYLMWVQAEWADSADTVEGRVKHKGVDAGSGKLPEAPEEGERVHARSVSLSSLKLGITAKLDLVEGEGTYVSPVDYKRGKRPHVDKGAYDPERVQLCAQGLLLREHGFECDSGVLYFVESRERVRVMFDEILIDQTLASIHGLRGVAYAGHIPPPLEDSPKCPRCSLVGICLPDEVRFLNAAPVTPRPLFAKEEYAAPLYVQSPRAWLPRNPGDYASFRTHTLDALSQRGAGAKEVKSVRATLPEDWLDAISLDTGELQAAGWSAPPAARQMYYRRSKDALRFMAARPAQAGQYPRRRITTARYALYAKPLPRFTDAVWVGETLRIALMGCARRLFGDEIPASLSGHDLPDGNRHGHAFFLPEMNQDDRVDHLIVHAPDGFDAQAQAALVELKTIYTRERLEWRLMLEGLGELDSFPASQSLSQSTIWLSASPYLHPWHSKKGFGVPEQIARECRLRGLPVPAVVELMPDAKPRALDFRRFRSKRGLRQPDRQGCFLRLTFDTPVRGPMALGFGCHFGLGLFNPA